MYAQEASTGQLGKSYAPAPGYPVNNADAAPTPELQLLYKRLAGMNEDLRRHVKRLDDTRDRLMGPRPEGGIGKAVPQPSGIINQLNEQVAEANETISMLADIATSFECIA